MKFIKNIYSLKANTQIKVQKYKTVQLMYTYFIADLIHGRFK